jgi:polyisoprenyl-phosphate glycosyltransferase
MKKVSVIIPFYNEQENIPKIYAELNAVTKIGSNYEFEILFMDNHSVDGSPDVVRQIQTQDPRVKYFRQSRNFGYQINIFSGYLNCTGDAAVQLDADGEDDPKHIIEFIKKWEDGYDVVYGIRVKRAEPFYITLQRKIFYRLLRSISEFEMPVDAGDFRLIDRRVIEALKGFKEANPYIRGLLSYAGFNQIGIPYERRPRYSGKSKFSWFQAYGMAWNAITAFSKKPLTIIYWLGISLCILSFVLSIIYLWARLTNRIPVEGLTSIILFQLFFSGINLLCLGILSSYIGRIFDEVKRRPHQFFSDKD